MSFFSPENWRLIQIGSAWATPSSRIRLAWNTYFIVRKHHTSPYLSVHGDAWWLCTEDKCSRVFQFSSEIYQFCRCKNPCSSHTLLMNSCTIFSLPSFGLITLKSKHVRYIVTMLKMAEKQKKDTDTEHKFNFEEIKSSSIFCIIGVQLLSHLKIF